MTVLHFLADSAWCGWNISNGLCRSRQYPLRVVGFMLRNAT
jgi:hypothetical protein